MISCLFDISPIISLVCVSAYVFVCTITDSSASQVPQKSKHYQSHVAIANKIKRRHRNRKHATMVSLHAKPSSNGIVRNSQTKTRCIPECSNPYYFILSKSAPFDVFKISLYGMFVTNLSSPFIHTSELTRKFDRC